MPKKDKQPFSTHEHRGAFKVPRSSFREGDQKQPRSNVPDYGGTFPLWAFRLVDLGGPWCWTRMDGDVLGEVLEKLRNYESMRWRDIEAAGSHFIEEHSKLCKAARDRLVEIQQDDTDSLFSLRITAKKRVWGIRDGGILRILWWDPEHQVYPVPKKHT